MISTAILAGDCRTRMAAMEDASIDSIVTDPPYELGFMGRSWDSTGVAYDVAVWRQALRVLKPGGWLLAFGGARTYHRLACAIEDAGFEIRDQIMWIYGSGFPKGGNRDGKGTCLKPAHEPIVMARKPFSGSVAANEARYGTGVMNIDACRVLRVAGDREDYGVSGDEISVPGNGRTMGRRDRVAYSPSELGRWPANVIHDGSETVLAKFPQSDSRGGRPKNNLSRSGFNGGWDGGNVKIVRNDAGSAARFFYCAKATQADRNEGCRDVVTRVDGEAKTGNIHVTVKPERLMRYLVRLVTPVGGTVLDPFAGSGSTGKAAILEGRGFIGCELIQEHIPIARARIAAACARRVAANDDAPFEAAR